MTTRKISRAEPVTELRKVPIKECGEPLVDFLEACPKLLFDSPRFTYRRETLCRKSLADRLCNAADFLPTGYRFAILEGWRAPVIQGRMYMATWNMFKEKNPDWSETRLKRVVNQFSAPMDTRVPPPHTTGGAVDLMLADDQGTLFDVQTPYEQRDPVGFFFAAKGLSDEARRHRDIQAEALLRAGVTNYPSEYWHWSYGDQGWAYRDGHPNALYGAVTPDGWTPAPEDDVEEPLVFVETAVE